MIKVLKVNTSTLSKVKAEMSRIAKARIANSEQLEKEANIRTAGGFEIPKEGWTNPLPQDKVLVVVATTELVADAWNELVSQLRGVEFGDISKGVSGKKEIHIHGMDLIKVASVKRAQEWTDKNRVAGSNVVFNRGYKI